jgi:hypothetical protein
MSDNKEIRDKAITALIIVLVVAVGLFAINQFFSWQYKNEFLQQPCGLCVKLNPNYTRCNFINTEIKNNYPSVNFTLLNITTTK